MRFGVKVGPFYVGTSTRRRRRGGGSVGGVIGLLLLLVVVLWPLYLGQEANGNYHAWVWAIAIPWWLLLLFVFLALLRSKSGKKLSAPPKPPAPQPVAVRPAKPAKPLPGIRSSIVPGPPWGWASPRVFKGIFGAVSISEYGIQLDVRKRAVTIPWPEVVAVDFLEPRFARLGHVHFVTAGDPRGLDVLTREKNPATAAAKNPHAIQFSKGQRAAYEELRRFIGG